MNMHIINVIIGREYFTRIKKKSFLIVTFLGPVFFAAISILPALIMSFTKEESKRVGIVDRSGIVLPYLESNERVTYSDYSAFDPDSVKEGMKELGLDVMLLISPLDSAGRTLTAETYSVKPLGMELSGEISGKVNDAVEDFRIASYNVDNLAAIMAEVKSDIKVKSYTVDEEGKATLTSSEVYMLISMFLGIIIYMFIMMFGGMVMASVIEEKSSRVVEVLVSSVKSTELMFGKIIGVALVALTQFLLWIVLTAAIVLGISFFMGPDFLSQGTVQMPQDPGMTQMTQQISDMASEPSELGAVLTTLSGLDFGLILGGFIVYFILGYLLYASLFAAIGSAVENEADTQQLQIPVTIPIMIGFFIALYAFKAPDSGVVFWGSVIPFTSPIVMLARLPFGVPAWQILLSVGLLAGTFVLCAWLSAKIYSIGILMFGKKTTFKDLWRWLKQK